MRLTLLSMLFLCGCTSTSAILRDEAGAFSVRDYLKTAFETLTAAETDTGGHRIRAQLETRAALDALDEGGVPERAVPFEGPPTLAVALALLEHSAPELAENTVAQVHAQNALAELREALK